MCFCVSWMTACVLENVSVAFENDFLIYCEFFFLLFNSIRQRFHESIHADTLTPWQQRHRDRAWERERYCMCVINWVRLTSHRTIFAIWFNIWILNWKWDENLKIFFALIVAAVEFMSFLPLLLLLLLLLLSSLLAISLCRASPNINYHHQLMDEWANLVKRSSSNSNNNNKTHIQSLADIDLGENTKKLKSKMNFMQIEWKKMERQICS